MQCIDIGFMSKVMVCSGALLSLSLSLWQVIEYMFQNI
jgi:hypothetical protein